MRLELQSPRGGVNYKWLYLQDGAAPFVLTALQSFLKIPQGELPVSAGLCAALWWLCQTPVQVFSKVCGLSFPCFPHPCLAVSHAPWQKETPRHRAAKAVNPEGLRAEPILHLPALPTWRARVMLVYPWILIYSTNYHSSWNSDLVVERGDNFAVLFFMPNSIKVQFELLTL